jgi:hypothetical protein
MRGGIIRSFLPSRQGVHPADCSPHTALPAANPSTLAGVEQGLRSVPLSNLVHMENTYSCKNFQWRITARPRISTQAAQMRHAEEMRLTRAKVRLSYPARAPTAAHRCETV